MAANSCSIAGCDNPISPRSHFTACPLCRASMGTWLKRRAAEIVERRRKLQMYDSRMSELVEYKTQKKA